MQENLLTIKNNLHKIMKLKGSISIKDIDYIPEILAHLFSIFTL
jgi:hypothetical protein